MTSQERSTSNILGRAESVVLRVNGAAPPSVLLSVLRNALLIAAGNSRSDEWIDISAEDEKLVAEHEIELGQGMAIFVIDAVPTLHSEHLLNQCRYELGPDRHSVYFSGFVWKRASAIADILTRHIDKNPE